VARASRQRLIIIFSDFRHILQDEATEQAFVTLNTAAW
jgi:hypothetical protein